MCQEVLEIVQGMDIKDVETKLALQCAPLITGIKISNLFIISASEAENIYYILRKTGITFFRLAKMEDKVTFLLFRRNQLAAYLQDSDVQSILLENGYKDLSLHGILHTFAKRYRTYISKGAGFPHEMGLLLGYPVEDVAGFITHKGQNFLYSGYWKVYANVPEKKQLFREYEDAQKNVVILMARGHGIRPIIKEWQRLATG